MAETSDTTTRRSPAKSNSLIPPEGDENVGYLVFLVLDEILKFKEQLGLSAKWKRNYELSRNRHWKNRNVKVPLVTANFLHSHRTRTVNTLTDNNPTFNVHQVGEVDADKEEVFDTLLKTAEFWWSDQEQQSVLERSVINGEMYGGTIEKVAFNPELDNEMGEVEAIIVDPFHFGWFPVKEPYDNQKSEAALHFYPESVRKLRMRYPEQTDKIQSDRNYIAELGDDRLELTGSKRGPAGYLTTFAGIIKNLLNISGEGSGVDDQTLLVEMWVRDATVRDDGKEGFKYPGKIRRILTCSGGRCVLADDPNPSINPDLDPEQSSLTYLYSRFPFSFTQSVTDTSDPWGMSDYEQLEELNIEVNKKLSQLALFGDRAARLKIINPKDSGVANEEFTNAPGIINPTSALTSQAIRYLDMPKLPQELPELLNIFREMFTTVAGSFDFENLQRTGQGVIAYKAIAALLERAATMLRGKIRNYSKMIRQRGRMYLSCAMNWYTEPRWISYEQDGKRMGTAINGKDLMVPAKLGVVSGSTMPVSRVQEREEALALFDKGAIDKEELLKKMDWPDWKEVIRRMNLGVLGILFERMSATGVPPALIEAWQQMGTMEEKDFDRAMEQGEIPPFGALLPGPEDMAAEGEAQLPPDVQNQMAIAQAQVQKIEAEADLVREKIVSERVEQKVKVAGVNFDEQKLKMERARIINEIKGAQEQMEKPLAAETKTKESEQRAQGPYRERGLKSNNKKE